MEDQRKNQLTKIQEESKQNNNETENKTHGDLWQSIGFHRPLAGFWYGITFMLFQVAFVAIFTALLWSYLYPFPESLGYRTAATSIFAVFFQIFDLGTANIMDRFIGEVNITKPQTMIKYIQYFIWYQAFTGLVQVTSVAVYALYFVPRGELAYAVWIMLIFSTTQYPGFLGVFRNVLGSLQQFNKTAILNFISGEVFQRITEIVFVILGRIYGENHPEIGPIMGIALGATIGYYLDDFIATAFSAVFFQKAMKKYGFRVRDCFRHDFDWETIREAFIFGLKTGAPMLLWPIVQLISLWMWIQYVPQYTTFVTFFYFAGAFGGIVSQTIGLGGAISESYMNNKPHLTQYYIGQTWRFTGMIQMFMVATLFLLTLILEPLFIVLNLDAYLLSIIFIIPKMVREIQQPYNNLSETILIGTNQPNFSMWMHFYEDLVALISWWLIIMVWKLPQTYGVTMIAWMLPCGELVAIVTKVLFVYIFLHKKVLPIKIPWWQTFIATGISALIFYLFGLVYYYTIFQWTASLSMLFALVLFLVFIIFVGLIFIYIPLTVYFGAWDDGSIRSFKNTTEISGPGQILTKPIYFMLLKSMRFSKYHNRFKMDESLAVQEAKELMAQRTENFENF